VLDQAFANALTEAPDPAVERRTLELGRQLLMDLQREERG